MVNRKKKSLENQSDPIQDHLLNIKDGQLLPSEPQVLENNKTDDLYWEDDEIIIPNQVIYNMENEENNDSIIEESQSTPLKKVISRNVSNSQRRRFR